MWKLKCDQNVKWFTQLAQIEQLSNGRAEKI